ncbi:MAG: radical SAM protein [Phycisphaerae bacterium]|nr:radical SAM protein [Phycisphaerae bacterium]
MDRPSIAPEPAELDCHHPLEDYLGTRPFRWLLRRLSRPGRDGTALERIISSYRNPDAPFRQRLMYWPIHLFIDRMRGSVPARTFRERLASHAPTVRGLVTVARSIAEFGLTRPQKFSAPLFAVWNLTNRCNLRCKHCYQNSDKETMDDELTLDEKLTVVDRMGDAYMPMLALSGGEPTMSGDLLPVLRRASHYKMHTTIATNGTTMTEKLAGELVEAGLRYVEISLDSTDPARHDAFRGVPGMWERSVRGAKIVVATEGLRLGIAMCVHRGNYSEVRDMIEFAISIGAGCFAHFNFIPVGRGLKMVSGDITPTQREELLGLLNEYMQAGKIGVISTAPQLGRLCLSGAPIESGKIACSHAGSGSGTKARVVAKYLGGCGAGRTYICIEPNGDVTPCVYLPHRVMGNLRDAGIVKIFRGGYYDLLNDRTERVHHCRTCDFADYCGGCRARSDAYFGRLDAGDPGCKLNEQYWDELVASGVVSEEASDDPAQLQLTPTRHGLA